MFWVVVLAPAKLKALSVLLEVARLAPSKRQGQGQRLLSTDLQVDVFLKDFVQGVSYSTLQGRRGRVPENHAQSS